MKRIYLVDVSSLFFRAFYAIRPLSSPSGLPVNAIYGFLSMTLKLLKEEKPDIIAFCFDRKEPSFRKEIDPNYKANRSEMPEDLALQMPYIRKIGPLLGIQCVDQEGFEADDVIGTLAIQALGQGCEVVIVSGDKDFAQLLQPGIVLYDTMKETRTGPAEALVKWGVKPEQMIDYLAIVGDSSDNIPGVSGLGPKGAQKLLTDFGTLDGIYANIESIKGATKEKLIRDKDNAYLSQKLVRIVTDVPIRTHVHEYNLADVDLVGLDQLLQDLNFKNLQKAIRDLPHYDRSAAGVAGQVVREAESALEKAGTVAEASLEGTALAAGSVGAEDFSFLVSELKEVSPSEFSKLAKPEARVWAFSASTGVYLHPEDSLILYRISGELSDWVELFDRQRYALCGFDLKRLCHEFKLRSAFIGDDLQVAAYILAPGDGSALERVVSKQLGEVMPDALDPLEQLKTFLRLQAKIFGQMDATQREIYDRIDLPLVSVLYKMERYGIRIDCPRLRAQSENLAQEIKILEKNIHQLAGQEFNVGSPKQLGQLLFETLKLPPSKKTKTGYSTDEDVLLKLKPLHPIAGEILKYRELTKLKSTYVDSLPQLVDAHDRIHSTFDQTLTTTGRLSSRDPNLQNIPIRTERGIEVRRSFIAADGEEILSIDYSQIELRILAHYSEDPNLIAAFRENLDIHAATASEIFGVPLAQVTSDHRRTAKAVNFGIAYGQGAFGLAETLGIPRGEAQDIIQRYFHRFPGVGAYIESTIARAKQDGFVTTLLGRKRYMTELKSANAAVRKFGERAAINAPIQGTAADIVKLAMTEVDRQVPAKMILQVHDELLFEGPPAQLREQTPKIISIMESVVALKVPLKVNAAQGLNWNEAH